MNKNKLSSLTNLSRKETDFCSKIWKCLFWLEGSCLFLVEEIKKLLFREQTLHLLLFLIPQSAVPKNSSPPLTVTYCLFSCESVLWRRSVTSHVCSTASIYDDLCKGDSGSQRTRILLSQWWNIEWHFKAKCTAILCSINKWCMRKYRKALSPKFYSW